VGKNGEVEATSRHPEQVNEQVLQGTAFALKGIFAGEGRRKAVMQTGRKK
jgi:hypothetical protein